MRVLRILVAAIAAISGVVFSGGGVSAAASSALVCSGGDIPSGTYSSVLVTGGCAIPAGLVQVSGNLTIAPGAALDATTPAGFFGPSPAPLPGIVQVAGSVIVGQGAVLFLGCDLAILCGPGSSTYPGPPGLFPGSPIGFSNPGDEVGGSIISDGALGVVVHSVKVGRNAILNGGGGGPAQLTGGPGSGACFNPAIVPPPAAWTETTPGVLGFPVYSDFEDNSIGGSLLIKGLQTCWFGSLRNIIQGSLIDQGNLAGDPDANEVLTNRIAHNIICEGNNSVVQLGDSGGAPNVVSGAAIGECSFSAPGPISVPGP